MVRLLSKLFHSFCSFRRFRFAALLLLPLTSTAWADDFAALDAKIAMHKASLAEMELTADRYANSLIEPLTSLAIAHMEANQFSEADRILDRTIQIVRINSGLFDAGQYDLLQLELENNRQRGNWKLANQELDHLQWLYTHRYEGNVTDLLQRLSWLSDTHLHGVFEDFADRQVMHLRSATGINQLAVEVSRNFPGVVPQMRAELLYDLVLKYALETQGIRRGGRTSYEIREFMPGSTTVQKRKDALRHRYFAGLAVLNEIQDLILQSPTPDPAALAMVKLHRSDWLYFFNETSEDAREYSEAYQELLAAGLPQDQLDAYFSQPVPLPRPSLYADIAGLVGITVDNTATALFDGSVQLIELSENFPGHVVTSRSGLGKAFLAHDWLTTSVSFLVAPKGLEVEPETAETDKDSYDRETMRYMAESELESQMEAVRKRVEKLYFRPALDNGVAVSRTVTIDYSFPVPLSVDPGTSLVSQR